MPSTSSPANDPAAARRGLSERDARRNRIARLDRLATKLDARFRILGIPVGWDSILGLIPGVGDLATALPGAAMFYEARRMGARKRAAGRIALNTGIDLALGTIPLVGDLFDVAFKSHRRNIAILKDELNRLEAREQAHHGRGGDIPGHALQDAEHDKEDTWQSDTDPRTEPATVTGFSEKKVKLGSREGMAARSSATSPARTNSSVPGRG